MRNRVGFRGEKPNENIQHRTALSAHRRLGVCQNRTRSRNDEADPAGLPAPESGNDIHHADPCAVPEHPVAIPHAHGNTFADPVAHAYTKPDPHALADAHSPARICVRARPCWHRLLRKTWVARLANPHADRADIPDAAPADFAHPDPHAPALPYCCAHIEADPYADTAAVHGRMKVAITGGRDYKLTPEDYYWLGLECAALASVFGFTGFEFIHGDARGVDREVATLLASRGFIVTPMPADWAAHGKVMAEACDLCLAFPGGRGTQGMVEICRKLGKEVRESPTRK